MEKVVHLISKEILRLKNEGLDNGELERAKRLLKGIYVRRLESSETRMIRLGEVFMSTGEAITSEETLCSIDNVTEEDVCNAASDVMSRDNLCMAVHASEESKKYINNLEGLDF